MKLRTIGIAVLTASTLPSLALASPAEGEGTLTAGPRPQISATETTTTETVQDQSLADAAARYRLDRRWIDRWAPERGMGEFGIFAGAFFPSPDHELFAPDPALPDLGFRPLARVAPNIGARIGYYPLRFLGVEFEGTMMPAQVPSVDDMAFVYSARGHLVLQLGLWSVTPFVLIGGGGLGVASDPGVLGNNIDPMVHFGGGLKIYINRYIALRIEARDIISHKRGEIEYLASHNPEVLLGLSITPGRHKDKAPVRVQQVITRDRVIVRTPEPEPEPEPEVEEIPVEPEVEIPPEVMAFTGTIRDISFETNSDELQVTSIPTLERATAVLREYPGVRMEIIGHTDDRGNRDHNIDLSRRRAEAVKTYLVKHGIDSDRIITSGAGPDEPIDTNNTKVGRANNRRIEFRVIQPTEQMRPTDPMEPTEPLRPMGPTR
ncbi:MAG: OmpA family protein [Enhygromyxa sp.]